MSIDTQYKTVQFIVNKQQTGGATPERVNLAFRIANSLLFKRYSGIPEQWMPNLPVSKMAYSINTDIEKVMRIFKQKTSLYINEEGRTNIPSDFIKESTITYITSDGANVLNIPVDVCNDIEFAERKNSYVVPANKDNPACNFQSTYIQFAPKDLVSVEIVYLRMPVTPIWGYTIVSNRPVYDAGSSVNAEWPEDVENDFIMLTCEQLGVNMQKDVLYQQMQAFKAMGT